MNSSASVEAVNKRLKLSVACCKELESFLDTLGKAQANYGKGLGKLKSPDKPGNAQSALGSVAEASALTQQGFGERVGSQFITLSRVVRKDVVVMVQHTVKEVKGKRQEFETRATNALKTVKTHEAKVANKLANLRKIENEILDLKSLRERLLLEPVPESKEEERGFASFFENLVLPKPYSPMDIPKLELRIIELRKSRVSHIIRLMDALEQFSAACIASRDQLTESLDIACRIEQQRRDLTKMALERYLQSVEFAMTEIRTETQLVTDVLGEPTTASVFDILSEPVLSPTVPPDVRDSESYTSLTTKLNSVISQIDEHLTLMPKFLRDFNIAAKDRAYIEEQFGSAMMNLSQFPFSVTLQCGPASLEGVFREIGALFGVIALQHKAVSSCLVADSANVHSIDKDASDPEKSLRNGLATMASKVDQLLKEKEKQHSEVNRVIHEMELIEVEASNDESVLKDPPELETARNKFEDSVITAQNEFRKVQSISRAMCRQYEQLQSERFEAVWSVLSRLVSLQNSLLIKYEGFCQSIGTSLGELSLSDEKEEFTDVRNEFSKMGDFLPTWPLLSELEEIKASECLELAYTPGEASPPSPSVVSETIHSKFDLPSSPSSSSVAVEFSPPKALSFSEESEAVNSFNESDSDFDIGMEMATFRTSDPESPFVSEELTAIEENRVVTAADLEEEEKQAQFRTRFGFPDEERLISSFSCAFANTFPLHGRLYVSRNHLSFHSPLMNSLIIIQFKEVASVTRENTVAIFPNAIRIQMADGSENLFISFLYREDAMSTINDIWAIHRVISGASGVSGNAHVTPANPGALDTIPNTKGSRHEDMVQVIDTSIPVSVKRLYELLFEDSTVCLDRLKAIYEQDGLINMHFTPWKIQGVWLERSYTAEKKLSGAQSMFGGKLAYLEISTRLYKSLDWNTLVIQELSKASGIMYSDCFDIQTDWDISSLSEHESRLVVSVRTNFTKSTVWAGTINRTVYADTGNFYSILVDNIMALVSAGDTSQKGKHHIAQAHQTKTWDFKHILLILIVIYLVYLTATPSTFVELETLRQDLESLKQVTEQTLSILREVQKQLQPN